MAKDYWRESLDYAFDAAGLFEVWDGLTDAQRDDIAKGIEGSAENYGTAMGHDVIANPLESEMRRRDKLAAQRLEDTENATALRIRELEDVVRRQENRIWHLQEEARDRR